MARNFDIKTPENFLSQIPYKRILAVVTASVAAFIFFPDNWLNKIGVLEIKNKFITIFGIVFIICISFWIMQLITIIYYKSKKAYFFSDKACRKRFEMLSDEAISIVVDMYHSKSHSLELEMSEATTVTLESINIIGRGCVSSGGCYFDYFLQPWVIKYLAKHISEYTSSN